MQFCTQHVEQLRNAIKLRDLYQFCAQSEEEASEYAEALMNGDTEDMFEPMIAAQCIIFEAAVEFGGEYLLGEDQDGNRYCPVCEAKIHGSRNAADILINGAADEVLAAAVENGILQPQRPN